MGKTITFSVQLTISGFGEGADEPTAQDLITIAQNIFHAVEHFRTNEGLSDADSHIYVECVESVAALAT